MQPIADLVLAARGGRRLRAPVGNDIIVALQIGRQLQQTDRPLAPIADRFDHKRGAAFIMRLSVEIFVEIAGALHQPEALGAEGPARRWGFLSGR